MQKIKNFLTSIIPRDGIFPLILTFLFNMTVYIGARLIASDWPHYNIESRFDEWIPFFPPSAVIYLGCYLFWAVNYILAVRQGKKEICQFFSAELLSKLICFLCFLLFPTTNVRPIVHPDGFWNQVMIFVYHMDAADNLFPSIHCLVSWFCYIGVRKRREIPVWYQTFSCVFALLVCISTLTTKQHVIWDVLGGVFLAEFCFWIAKKTAITKVYAKLLDNVNKKLYS